MAERRSWIALRPAVASPSHFFQSLPGGGKMVAHRGPVHNGLRAQSFQSSRDGVELSARRRAVRSRLLVDLLQVRLDSRESISHQSPIRRGLAMDALQSGGDRRESTLLKEHVHARLVGGVPNQQKQQDQRQHADAAREVEEG